MSKFDWNKPTALMLGRYQPWHDGHTELFKKAYEDVGQVIIMIRWVYNVDGDAGGGRTKTIQDDNPFHPAQVWQKIKTSLSEAGFTKDHDYLIMNVPNIVDVAYGRDVGYSFTQHDLGDIIHDISATKIRAELREKGEI